MKKITFGYTVTFYYQTQQEDSNRSVRLQELDKIFEKIKNEILLSYVFENEHRIFMRAYIDRYSKN